MGNSAVSEGRVHRFSRFQYGSRRDPSSELKYRRGDASEIDNERRQIIRELGREPYFEELRYPEHSGRPITFWELVDDEQRHDSGDGTAIGALLAVLTGLPHPRVRVELGGRT